MNTSIRNLLFATAMLLATTGLAHADYNQQMLCLDTLQDVQKRILNDLDGVTAQLGTGNYCAAMRSYERITDRCVSSSLSAVCLGAGTESYGKQLDLCGDYNTSYGKLIELCYD